MLFEYIGRITTTEHIHYWLDTAAYDWDTVQALQAANPRLTLVFAHWTLEKLSKALWIREHDGALPPASDDVVELLTATSFTLVPAQATFVGRLKAFHDAVVEADLLQPASQLLAGETAGTLLAQADALRQELQNRFIEEEL